MRDINDIIEAALKKGRQTIIETNDDEIDDWEPDSDVFTRLDEAKPVAPLKPLKPGETRKDAEAAADPNHEDHDAQAKAQANAEADETEANAPRDNKAVDAATAMLKDKNIPVNDETVKAAKDAADGKATQPTGSAAAVYAKNAAMNAAKKALQNK